MRFRILFLFLGLTAILLGACGGSDTSQITPADGKLTFLFFYTDG
jgi:ABC-type glycerol-3-phosphate transport system substrate-binding protein